MLCVCIVFFQSEKIPSYLSSRNMAILQDKNFLNTRELILIFRVFLFIFCVKILTQKQKGKCYHRIFN